MSGIPLPMVRANQWFIVLTVAAGILLERYGLLALPFFTGLCSLLFRFNPLFSLVRPFLKKPLSEYIREDADQQRFNQWISVIFLGIALAAFALNATWLGILFGLMVAVAALMAIFGFCIGCVIRYRYLRWKHAKQTR